MRRSNIVTELQESEVEPDDKDTRKPAGKRLWICSPQGRLRQAIAQSRGQIRGIAKMIEEDKYCIDVLTQISAANNALRSVALNLLDEHLDHCVSSALAEGGDEAQAKLSEASAAIARLVRS